MIMIRIGLDIDGCILDYTKLLAKDYYCWCQEKGFTPKEVNNVPTRFEDIISSEHMDEFETSKEFTEYFFGKPREGVIAFIEYIKDVKNRLRSINDDIELYIITARQNLPKKPFGYKEFFSSSLTDRWLKSQGIEHTGLEFGVKDKAKLCKMWHFDYMIEDDINNALSIADKGTCVLLFDTILNKKENIDKDNIIRVYSMFQIKAIIEQNVQKILDLNSPTNLSGVELYFDR